MCPRRKCNCGAYLTDFPSQAPAFMVTYFEYCPECKAVYYIGEDL